MPRFGPPKFYSMGCKVAEHTCPLCPKESMNSSEQLLKKILYDDPHSKSLSLNGIDAIEAMTGSLEIMSEVFKSLVNRGKDINRQEFFDDILLAISDEIED